MTAVHEKQLVDGYLGRLEIELKDLPEARRREIVDEIRNHIAEERRNDVEETDADLLNLLDRLGEPAEIAAEARGADAGARRAILSRFGTTEVLALALLILAWPLGVVVLWASRAWTTPQKLLGTLLPPGGYISVFLVMASFRDIDESVNASSSSVQVAVAAVLFIVSLLLVLAPIGMVTYLATRLRARPVPG